MIAKATKVYLVSASRSLTVTVLLVFFSRVAPFARRSSTLASIASTMSVSVVAK